MRLLLSMRRRVVQSIRNIYRLLSPWSKIVATSTTARSSPTAWRDIAIISGRLQRPVPGMITLWSMLASIRPSKAAIL